MRALIIGATGATGKDLVDILLRDPDYTDVVIFVRRASGVVHPKLKPGLLLRKDTDRLGERISASAIHFLNGLGIMKKFRPMPTEILAEKLAKVPKVCSNGTHVIELDGIFEA